MTTTCTIRGIPITFPFEPYTIQKDYMDRVLECLQNGQNGVLESPTGTGKTLSLLCSSLAWLEVKKAQVQLQRRQVYNEATGEFDASLQQTLDEVNAVGSRKSLKSFLGMPTIIYASRTHSQLSQAMQELKRSAYNHLKASVLGSREQMCIHPELLKEKDAALKLHMCRLKVKTKSCHFQNKVERKKDDPAIADLNIIDIEDIVKLGESHKFCPYYMTKELKDRADIIFMPYNYLLDPRARKALGVELANNVIILDEGHNIEKICEDSASMQIKSTDITLAIEEVTAIMKFLDGDIPYDAGIDVNTRRDFDAEDLCILKQMLLDFEKHLDAIPLKGGPEGTTFEGSYIFELLGKAGINDGNHNTISVLIDKLIEFLATASAGDGPFQRRGNGLQIIVDLLTIAYASVSPEFKQKLQKAYKVHVELEQPKKKTATNWLSKMTTANSNGRVLSFWCFSPGFGMNMLMDKGIHCVILTSGTLAPLKPLISELELDVGVRLENPHIVTGQQVCVKILTKGPDMEILNSNFQNRDNPRYLSSLGNSILNLVRHIPDGILIFFPSYPVMLKCQQFWQETGVWHSINSQKAIYVEPRDKISFNTAMSEYYSKINDPNFKGAIFMGVCRGKVSEGLDFADANGRAVFITGLPYPPLKDPRVILKRRYLDVCNSKDKEYLRGEDWYSLEASRAVNQAIGRVIRHRHDFGAIILMDTRFTSFKLKNQMSRWLQGHIKVVQNFGEIIRDLRSFFKNARETLPEAKVKKELSEPLPPTEFEMPDVYKKNVFDFNNLSSTDSCSASSSTDGSITAGVNKRPSDFSVNVNKRKRISIVPNTSNAPSFETTTKEYILMVKNTLDEATFKLFLNAMAVYKENIDIIELKQLLDDIFLPRLKLRYVIRGLEPYIKAKDKEIFDVYCNRMQC